MSKSPIGPLDVGGWIDMPWTIGWWTRNKPEPILYHYTTAAGLRGIVETQALWATGVRFLNDASEMHYAADTIVRLLSAELETSD